VRTKARSARRATNRLAPELTRVTRRDSLFFLFLLLCLFLQLVILSLSPPFPPKNSAAPGLAEHSTAERISSCPSSARQNPVSCHGGSPAADSPTQTTHERSHPEGSAKPPQHRGKGSERSQVTPGELGRRGRSAESFLPPPKENQFTEGVCLNSTEKLNTNRSRISPWMNSVTARGYRACEPAPNASLLVFSSSHLSLCPL